MIDPIVAIATQGITPEKIALTLAVGSAVAVFPVPGTTTLLCILVGILLRLNQPIILLVNGIMTPVHVAVIYGCLRLGAWLFSDPSFRGLGMHNMNHMFWEEPRLFWSMFGTAFFHAVVAWVIVAPFWITLAYCIAMPTCRDIERRIHLSKLVSQDPPDQPAP